MHGTQEGDTVIVTVPVPVLTVANRSQASQMLAADNENNTETKLSVYPNPVTDTFNLQFSSNINGKVWSTSTTSMAELLRRVAIEKTNYTIPPEC